jgi:hypothetical protein
MTEENRNLQVRTPEPWELDMMRARSNFRAEAAAGCLPAILDGMLQEALRKTDYGRVMAFQSYVDQFGQGIYRKAALEAIKAANVLLEELDKAEVK